MIFQEKKQIKVMYHEISIRVSWAKLNISPMMESSG